MWEYRAFVKKVYDGDTITVDFDLGFGIILKDQKVRLLGVAAPEVRGAQREEGLVSRDALTSKIINKWITLRTEKDKKGKFGRWLGTVILEGENINEWLINEGYAKEYV